MRENCKIITVCNQSLKNVQHAVRAYNMYRHLERLGCRVTYLDGWKPRLVLDKKNIVNWMQLFFYKRFGRKNSRIFLENVQPFLASKIIKKVDLPIILDVRDDHNLHAESMGIHLSRKTHLLRELAQIENFEIAENILVASDSYVNYYSRKYNGQYDGKFIVVMNASDSDRFRNKILPDEPRIGILGGANPAEGFDSLIEACRLVKARIPNLSVHIGYKYLPQTKSYVVFLRNRYNMSWVYFYGDIQYTTNAPDFYSSMYLCVIPRRKTTVNDISTPSKLFDSMASARPLVVTNLMEQAKIVRKENCGLICDFTPKDMASKITKLLKDRELAQIMGQRGRRAVEEKHNWKIRAKKIIEEVF